jgi:hypothetical protein
MAKASKKSQMVYIKLRSKGVPEEFVRLKMLHDGFDPSLVEDFFRKIEVNVGADDDSLKRSSRRRHALSYNPKTTSLVEDDEKTRHHLRSDDTSLDIDQKNRKHRYILLVNSRENNLSLPQITLSDKGNGLLSKSNSQRNSEFFKKLLQVKTVTFFYL